MAGLGLEPRSGDAKSSIPHLPASDQEWHGGDPLGDEECPDNCSHHPSTRKAWGRDGLQEPDCLRRVLRMPRAPVHAGIAAHLVSFPFPFSDPTCPTPGFLRAEVKPCFPASAPFPRPLKIEWEPGFLNEVGGDKESHPPPMSVECPVHIPAATVSKFANRHLAPHHHVSSFMHGHLCRAARPVATQPTTAPQGPDISESKLTRGVLILHAKQPGPPQVTLFLSRTRPLDHSLHSLSCRHGAPIPPEKAEPWSVTRATSKGKGGANVPSGF